MTSQKKIVAIVPAYNEEATIEGVIDDLISHGIEPIIVDDGSNDSTYVKSKNKNVHVIKHLLNRGQGAALQTGMEYAISLKPDCIIHFDSDGQHLGLDIKRICQPIFSGHYDIVLGSRFLKDNKIPPIKRALLLIAIYYTRITTGLAITDTHNGLRAFSPKAAIMITIRQSGMAHASEILDIISAKRLRYIEVPVTVVYSPYSMSKGQKLSNSFQILYDLWFK